MVIKERVAMDFASCLTLVLWLLLLEQDAPVQPSLIIVYFGGNDSMGPHSSGLGPHVPLPEYIQNMRTIANHLKVTSLNFRICSHYLIASIEHKLPCFTAKTESPCSDIFSQFTDCLC